MSQNLHVFVEKDEIRNGGIIIDTINARTSTITKIKKGSIVPYNQSFAPCWSRGGWFAINKRNILKRYNERGKIDYQIQLEEGFMYKIKPRSCSKLPEKESSASLHQRV